MTENNQALLIEKLVQRMDLDRIFLFSYPFGDTEEQHLLLVVNPVQGISPNAMKPIVSLCMADTVEMGYDMILTGEWQNRLKQGSLYYTYASLPSHERYTNSKKKSPLFSRKVVSGLLEVAQLNYDKCKKNAVEFMDACRQYRTKGDYGQALFMLHQFVEFRLKGFQTILGVNSGKSHNIKHMMKMMRGVTVQLSSIFDYDGPWAAQLSLLDQSYNRIKKQDSVIVSPEDLELIMERSVQLAHAMDGMVETMVDHVTAYREGLKEEKEKVPVDQNAVSTQSSSSPTAAAIATQIICEDFSGFPWLQYYKEDANKLLDKIRANHNPEQIVMLNYHTGSFSGSNLFQQEEKEKDSTQVELYLAVIMKNTGPFHFKCLQVGVASAMVVYLSIKEVEKKLATGDRFVHTLWTKGHVLRRKSSFEPQFTVGEVDWKKEYEEMESGINTTKHVIGEIQGYLELNDFEDKVNYCILKTMLEAVVISYLHCAVGYVPKDVPLRDLADWTGVCSRELIEFLQPKKQVESRQIHLFLRPEKMWMNGFFGQLSEYSFLSGNKVQSHLVFYDKLLDEVLQQNKLPVRPKLEIEAVGEI